MPDGDIFEPMMQMWQQRRATHPRFTSAHAQMLRRQSRLSDAVAMFENRNTQFEKAALLNLFFLYFTQPENASAMAGVMRRLRTAFPNDPEVLEALWFYHFQTQNASFARDRGEKLVEAQPINFLPEQNYPTPFSPTTTIRFQNPSDNWASLKAYNMLGQEVATLVNEQRSAGKYEKTFDASRLSSGVYIYRLTAGGFAASRKFVLMR